MVKFSANELNMTHNGLGNVPRFCPMAKLAEGEISNIRRKQLQNKRQQTFLSKPQ